MKRITKPFSIEEIKQIYCLSKKDENLSKIAREFGRNVTSIRGLLESINRNWDRKEKTKGFNKEKTNNYIKAIKEIKAESFNGKKEIPPVTHDRFSGLEEAFINFQNSISKFIEEQLNFQAEDINRENQSLKTEVNNLKREITDLTPLIDEARRSNWIGNLRKKFGEGV